MPDPCLQGQSYNSIPGLEGFPLTVVGHHYYLAGLPTATYCCCLISCHYAWEG